MSTGAAKDRFQRAATIFGQVRGIASTEERTRAIEIACEGDDALIREVQNIVAHDVEDGDVPPGPRLVPQIWGEVQEGPMPARIGDFKIIRRLGSGGMGVVYEAEQASPQRRVAIKLLGPWAADAAKRLTREAQILARFAHEGIARIYDAGRTGDQPYVVMELIEGEPIDVYADANELDARGRVTLIASVCDAVAHAHRRGVIHRDLKPENVLVTPDGVAKVLDFSVARPLDAVTQFTSTGTFVGTLGYMSPEQASGAPNLVDTRIDVFALGAVLFRLLTGSTPHVVADESMRASLERIERASAPDPRQNDARIDKDLAIIVRKALARDPERRYGSVEALAVDLRRWLGALPIRARPPSATYLMRSFVRRHKGVVAAAALALASILAGLILALLARQREAEQRHRAEDQTERSALVAAGALLREDDRKGARRQLDAIPDSRRKWEWQYLDAQLDTALSIVALGSDVTIKGSQLRADGQPGDAVTLSNAGDHRAIRLDLKHDFVRQGYTFVHRGQSMRAVPHGPDLEIQALGASGESAPRRLRGGHTNEARGAVYHSESGLLATSSTDCTVCIWDVETGTLRARCAGTRGPTGAIAFDAEGDRIAGASADGSIYIWQVRDGTLLHTLFGHDDGIAALAFASAGRHLVTASGKEVRLWSTAPSDNVIARHKPPQPYVYGLAVGAQGMHVYSGGWDGAVHATSLTTGLSLWTLRTASPIVHDLTADASGRWLAVASGGLPHDTPKQVELFDLSSTPPTSARSVSGDFTRVLFHADSTLVAYRRDGTVLRINPSDAGQDSEWKTPRIASRSEHGLAIDRRSLVVARGTNVLRFDVATGTKLGRYEGDGAPFASACLSPNSRLLAAGDARGVVFVWDVASGRRLYRLPGHTAAVWALAFTDAGTRLASGGADSVIRFWHLESGTETLILRGHRDYVYRLRFTPDGKTLLSASGDGTVRRWSTRK